MVITKSKLFALGVVLAVSMLFGACGHNTMGPTPSPVNPIPVPNPEPGSGGVYEAVPTERHYLLDASGAKTHMWVRLLAELVPARGSTITLGSANLCADCFRDLQVEFGVDSLNNPATSAGFKIGFSQDGINISTLLITNSLWNGSSAQTDSKRVWMFGEVPKYLVAQASIKGDSLDPAESGTTNFPTGYLQ